MGKPSGPLHSRRSQCILAWCVRFSWLCKPLLARGSECSRPAYSDATPAPTKVSPQVALANDSKPVGLGRAGLDRGVRGQKLPPSFGPCRSGFCNMYLTMRCESWRIANTNSGDLPDIPLLVALRDRAEPEVVRQLGLNANWTVLHVTTAVRPQHATPLEVTRADPTFRFAGLPWNYDPLHGNLTGKWNEFGDIDRRLKFEDKALEQILVAFFVLLALMFALLGQQRFVSLSPSAALADSADWHAVGFNSRTLRRPWPMRREARKMLGHRSA
ncbi:unnamed protein product [Effrenium voratum]|nr:unnamed protein product [Effrenium voratum]